MTIDFRISNSKQKTWNRCHKKYEYRYVQGYTKKKRELALERGTWMHELLQAYYMGRDWKRLHKILTKQFNNLFEEEREGLGDLPSECLRLMRSYLRHYPDDHTRYAVVDSEMDEIVTMPNGLKVQVIVDLIVEDRTTGLLWPWDHKTRKNFAEGDDLLLDPQLTSYFWALQEMGYKPLGGVAYNEICTKPPSIPSMLKSGGLTKRKNIVTDVYTYMSEIRRLELDPNDYADILRHIAVTQKGRWFTRTFLPKDPPMVKQMMRDTMWSAEEMIAAEKRGRFPRTFQAKNCKWDCDYLDMCITELHGGDTDPIIRAKMETRDQRKKREMRERKRRDRMMRRGKIQ